MLCIKDHVARSQAEVSPPSEFFLLLWVALLWSNFVLSEGRESLCVLHVEYGLVCLQIGLLGSIRMRKIWAAFTLCVFNNFHVRGEPHMRRNVIKGRSWVEGITLMPSRKWHRSLIRWVWGLPFFLNSFWFNVCFLFFLILQIETYSVNFVQRKRHSFVYGSVMERNRNGKPVFRINLEDFPLS